MKKFKVSLIKILVILFINTISVSIFAKPYYTIDNLKIEARINSDGSVDVTELVLYNAYYINGILYNIDYKGYGKLKNLEVFYKKEREFIPAVKNETGQKGSYEFKDNDDLAEIKLHFPMTGERKWFLFNYTLSEGITVYNDIAQFNRKMIGKGWQTDIENIEVKIILPNEINKEDIKAFGHGPLTGNVDIINGKEIIYTLKEYYSGEFVEINILFPKSLVPHVNPKIIKNENAYEKIMKIENSLAYKADRKRKFAKIQGIIGDLSSYFWWGWIIFVVGLNYIENKKRYKVKNEYEEYFREAPDNFSPAVGGAIAYKNVSPNQLLATVMDLVRRDIFQMIEDKENNKTILRKTDYDLKTLKIYEKFVVDWYIDEIGNGIEVSMEDIEENIKDEKNAIAFGKKYEEWTKMVKKDLENVGFKKEPLKKLPIALGMGTELLSLLSLGIIPAINFDNINFIKFPFVSFAVVSFALSNNGKYTLEAEKLRIKWLAFKKFLTDYSNLEEAKLTSIHIWEHYFVYAIALGVSEKVAKGYEKIFKDSDNTSRFGRTSVMRIYERNSEFKNIERIISNYTSKGIIKLSKSKSSSRGGGGSFSGGSSGGGGSRSGGGAF